MGNPCSVIGGYVYRGSAIPWLRGVYVYGRLLLALEVSGLRYADGQVVEHQRLADTDPAHHVLRPKTTTVSLYLLSQKSGIYRLTEVAGRRIRTRGGRTSSVNRAIWPIWSGEANLTMK